MTIGAICCVIFGVLLLGGGIAFGIYLIREISVGGGITTIVISVILAALLIVIPFVYMQTEKGQRALKSQKSNFSGGIERTITIYDINGEVIKTYDGRFDIDYNSERIIFDDENSKRHIIYYTTGTITIDEK